MKPRDTSITPSSAPRSSVSASSVPRRCLVRGVRHRGAGRRRRAACPASRGVTLQLGVDLRVPGPAGRGQPEQDRPAQLGVHGQARHLGAAVQQPGEQVELVRRGRGPAEQLGPGELVIADPARRRAAAEVPAAASSALPSGTHAGSPGQRHDLIGQRVQGLQHRDRGLLAHAARQQPRRTRAARARLRAPCRSPRSSTPRGPAGRRTRRSPRSGWPATAGRSGRARSRGRRR